MFRDRVWERICRRCVGSWSETCGCDAHTLSHAFQRLDFSSRVIHDASDVPNATSKIHR